MKISREQALTDFGIALGGAYAVSPVVDKALAAAYDAFADGLAASGLEPSRAQLRAVSQAACHHGVRSKPETNAALAVAQSFYAHLLAHPSAAPDLLRDPALVMAALDEHWPTGLDRTAVAARIAFACPEAAERLLAD